MRVHAVSMAALKVEGVADMQIRARFSSLVPVAMLAALVLGLSACKKPEVPTPTPTEPKAAQTEVSQADSGTTTTFAPPAPEPTQETAPAPSAAR
jgi:hypothetical protein